MRAFLTLVKVFCLFYLFNPQLFASMGLTKTQLRQISRFKNELTPEHLAKLKLTVAQIRKLSLSDEQRTGIGLTPAQLAKIKLNESQYNKIQIKKSQINRLGISEIQSVDDESTDSSQDKKIGKELSDLTMKDLANLELSEKQFTLMGLSESQQNRLRITDKQLELLHQAKSTMLTTEQFEKINLTEDQIKSIIFNQEQILIVESFLLTPLLEELDGKQLEDLQLNGDQIMQLELTKDQLSELKVTKAQAKVLKLTTWIRLSSVEKNEKTSELQSTNYPLSAEQFEILNLSSEQRSRLSLNPKQMKILRTSFEGELEKKSFLKMQRYITSNIIKKLNLSYDQIQQLDLSSEQLLNVKLTSKQLEDVDYNIEDYNQTLSILMTMKSTGRNFEELSSAEQFKIEKLIELMKEIPLNGRQLAQIPIKKDQLEKLSLDIEQKKIVKDHFNYLMMKDALLNSLKSEFGQKYSAIHLDENQIKSLKLTTDQILQVELTNEQLKIANLTKEDVDNFKEWKKGTEKEYLNKFKQEEGEFKRKLKELEEIGNRLNGIRLNSDQINIANLTNNQIDNLTLNSKQVYDVLYNASIHDKRRMNESYIEFLRNNISILSDDEELKAWQMSDVSLTPEQIAELDLDIKQLNAVSVSIGDYNKFKELMKKKIESGVRELDSEYETQILNKVYLNLKNAPLTQQQFLSLNLSRIQLKRLNLAPYQVYNFVYLNNARGRKEINRSVMSLVQNEKELKARYLITDAKQRVEANRKLVDFLKNLSLIDVKEKDLFSTLQIKQVPIDIGQIVKLDFSTNQLNERGISYEDFLRLKKLHEYYEENRVIELTPGQKNNYELLKKKAIGLSLTVAQFLLLDLEIGQLESVKFSQKQVDDIIDIAGADKAKEMGVYDLYSRYKPKTLDEIILDEAQNRKRLIRGILNSIRNNPENAKWFTNSQLKEFDLLPFQMVEANYDSLAIGRAGITAEDYQFLKNTITQYYNLDNVDVPPEVKQKALDISDKLSKLKVTEKDIVKLTLNDEQLSNITFSKDVLLDYLKSAEGKRELFELASERLGYENLEEFLQEIYTFEEGVLLNGLFVKGLKIDPQISLTDRQLNYIKYTPMQLSEMTFSQKEKDDAKLFDTEIIKFKELLYKYGENGPRILDENSDVSKSQERIKDALMKVILTNKQINSLTIYPNEISDLKLTLDQIDYIIEMTTDIVQRDMINRAYLDELRNLEEEKLNQINFPKSYINEVRIRTEQLANLNLSTKQLKDQELTKEDIKTLNDLLSEKDNYTRGSPAYKKIQLLEERLRNVDFTRKQLLSLNYSSDQIKRININSENVLFFQEDNLNRKIINILKNQYMGLFKDNFVYMNQNEMLSKDQRSAINLSFKRRLEIEYNDDQYLEMELSKKNIEDFIVRRERSLIITDDRKDLADFNEYNTIYKKFNSIPKKNEHLKTFDLNLTQIKSINLDSDQLLTLALETKIADELILSKITDKLKSVNNQKYRGFSFSGSQIESLKLSERQLLKALITPIQLSLVGLSREKFLKYKEWKQGIFELKDPTDDRDSTINNIIDIEKKIRNVILNNGQLANVDLNLIQKENLKLNLEQLWHVLQVAYQYDIGLEGDISEIEKIAKDALGETGDSEWAKRSFHKERDYKSNKKSLINWRTVNTEEYLDLREWKNERKLKDESPFWVNILREKKLSETVGRFIDCIGECLVLRGAGDFKANSRSKILEGDELVNKSDSYAWIYMLDGSIVRISPQSSVTINEINVGKKKIFFQLRINWGNVLWLSREKVFMDEKVKTETDTLFLPLNVREANVGVHKLKYTEDDLFSLVDNKQHYLRHYKKLNTLINENNFVVRDKVTSVLFVMPNGNIYADFPSLEMVVLSGNKSYFKSRNKLTGILQFENKNLKPATYYYRGYNNKESFVIDTGQWYEVDKSGLSLDVYDGIHARSFMINEKFTSHIPTILMAREIFFKRYSEQLFEEDLSAEKLASDYGYRLWEDELYGKKTDLEVRIDYLLDYTRKIESQTLLSTNSFRKKIEHRTGEKVLFEEYGDHFYLRAADDFALGGNKEKYIETDRESLNSEQNPFWKFIQRKRKNSKEYLIYRN